MAKNFSARCERVDQGVGVGFVVVNVERSAGRGGDSEHAHERLGAVVAGAHAHGLLVDDLRDVVGVDAVEQERDRPAPHVGVERAVDREVVAEALLEGVEGVRREAPLVRPHVRPCRAR